MYRQIYIQIGIEIYNANECNVRFKLVQRSKAYILFNQNRDYMTTFEHIKHRNLPWKALTKKTNKP